MRTDLVFPIQIADGSSPIALEAVSRRRRLVEEAIRWPRGPSVRAPNLHLYFEGDGFYVYLAKPGDEAGPEFGGRKRKRLNPNDMLPRVFHGEVDVEFTPSFTYIFMLLSVIAGQDMRAAEIAGALLVRSAFMLDHDAGLRYAPPPEYVQEVRRRAPTVANLPIEVFLQTLDALALQEDVKYTTLRYDISTGIGRTNTLLTCAHALAVAMGRVPAKSFVSEYTGRSLAPMSVTAAISAFGLEV